MTTSLGKLLAIHVTSTGAAPMRNVAEIDAVAGQGLSGDRYEKKQGTFQRDTTSQPSQQVTLIEIEAVRAALQEYDIEFTPADTRRNLLTEGVALNHLVGREFHVGNALLRGVELCEPCGHLEKFTCAGITRSLIHRGGLRAEVMTGGMIKVGDVIRMTKEARNPNDE